MYDLQRRTCSQQAQAEKLTTFYLAMALGGWLGGVLVGLVAPAVFNFQAERLVVIATIAGYTVYELSIKKFIQRKQKTLTYASAAVVAAGIAGTIVWMSVLPPTTVYRERNFYSAIQVKNENGCMVMYHGRIKHGSQYLALDKQNQPVDYYWLPVDVIDAFVRQYRKQPVYYGSVGLGVGVLAAYGKPGDRIDYFELDPKVVKLARKYFTFIDKSKASKIDIAVGDGRRLLEELPPQQFDILFIDAFNGDAIPSHLLTKQAGEVYLRHIKPDGFIAFHVSNLYLNLPPLLGKLAKELGMKGCVLVSKGATQYVVLSKRADLIDKLEAFGRSQRTNDNELFVCDTPAPPNLQLWTDDRSNLMSVIRF